MTPAAKVLVRKSHVELQGLAEVSALFKSVLAALGEKEMLRLILEESKPIGHEMAVVAPRDTGRLAAATKAWISKKESAVRIGTKTGKKGAPYAHFVEYGTGPHATSTNKAQVLSNQEQTFGTRTRTFSTAARPYIRPTWDSNQQGLLDGLVRRFQRILDNIAKGSFPPPLPAEEPED